MERFESLPEPEVTPMDDEMHDELLSPLDRELHELIQRGLTFAANSPQRRKIGNEIVRRIQQSRKLWYEDKPYYEDALMKTWRYFWLNLWEATTSKKKTAFSDRDCHIIARLNAYLRKRLLDGAIAQTKAQKRLEQQFPLDGEWADVAESIPAPQDCEEMQRLRELIKTDPTGELRQTHVRKREDITAQKVLQQRGLDVEPWDRLSDRFQASHSTLSGFYYDKCLPLIKRLFDTGY